MLSINAQHQTYFPEKWIFTIQKAWLKINGVKFLLSAYRRVSEWFIRRYWSVSCLWISSSDSLDFFFPSASGLILLSHHLLHLLLDAWLVVLRPDWGKFELDVQTRGRFDIESGASGELQWRYGAAPPMQCENRGSVPGDARRSRDHTSSRGRSDAQSLRGALFPRALFPRFTIARSLKRKPAMAFASSKLRNSSIRRNDPWNPKRTLRDRLFTQKFR